MSLFDFARRSELLLHLHSKKVKQSLLINHCLISRDVFLGALPLNSRGRYVLYVL